MMMMMKLSHVNAGYDGVDVVQNVSFEVKDGENLCIMGPNGCGKTTLLRAIAGLIPSSGEILLGDTPLKKLRRRELARRVAVLSQMAGITFPYSIAETVRLGRYARNSAGLFGGQEAADRKQEAEVVERCLRAVGLWELREHSVNTLSGGQLQRVFLARALAQEPSVILLDEPTNHLDLRYQAELIRYLRDWGHQPGHAVVGVLHNIPLGLQLADRVLFLKDGSALACGRPKEIMTGRLLEEVYDMNVLGYMRDALAVWADIKE